MNILKHVVVVKQVPRLQEASFLWFHQLKSWYKQSFSSSQLQALVVGVKLSALLVSQPLLASCD